MTPHVLQRVRLETIIDAGGSFAIQDAIKRLDETWKAIRIFMQQGIQGIDYQKHTQDFDPNLSTNPLLVMRPPVVWPMSMDAASRTAHNDELVSTAKIDETRAKRTVLLTRLWMTVLIFSPGILGCMLFA